MRELKSIHKNLIFSIAGANPNAPWASFWPGFTIFMIVLSFFIFHLGLKGLGSISRRRTKAIELE